MICGSSFGTPTTLYSSKSSLFSTFVSGSGAVHSTNTQACQSPVIGDSCSKNSVLACPPGLITATCDCVCVGVSVAGLGFSSFCRYRSTV